MGKYVQYYTYLFTANTFKASCQREKIQLGIYCHRVAELRTCR